MKRTTTLHHAEDHVIKDSGGYFTGTDVEGALQEAGAKRSVMLLGFHTAPNSTVPASTTYYGAPFKYLMNATGNNTNIPLAGTIRNLIFAIASQPATGSLVVTVDKNGAATALTATCPAGGSGTYQDSTHSFDIVAGDGIRFSIVNNATGTSGGLGAILVVFEVDLA